MGQTHVTLEERFAVPPEALFDAIADHAAMGRWLGVKVEVIRGDGAPGTVRRMGSGPLSFDEEVTYVDRPRRLVYRIVRGVPGLSFHRGEQLVAPWGETGSTLRWDIQLASPIPGLPTLLAAALGPALRKGLAALRRQLAEAHGELRV